MTIPDVIPIRQVPPQPVVHDVAGEARRRWEQSGVGKRVKRGDRVAVGVGSRGIANLAVLVRATLDFWRHRFFLHPFPSPPTL